MYDHTLIQLNTQLIILQPNKITLLYQNKKMKNIVKKITESVTVI